MNKKKGIILGRLEEIIRKTVNFQDVWRKEYKKQNKRKRDIKNWEKQCSKLDLLWKLLLYFHITHTQHIQEFPKAITMDCNSYYTVKTVALEHLILTEIITQLQSWIKAEDKSSISFLVKSKQFLVDQKDLAHMTWSVGKLETQLQSTQIRVTEMYDLQKLLTLKEFRIISRN